MFVLVIPASFHPYIPVNHNRSKTHVYFGYSDISSTDSDPAKFNSLLSPQFTIHCQPLIIANPPSSSQQQQQHFDRVLMPVSIRQTLPITDMQAGALLGPKGERIQQLQRETGAIVNISDMNDENGDRRKRMVNVQGSQQQVNNALQAIRKVLMINNNGENDVEDLTKSDGIKMKKI